MSIVSTISAIEALIDGGLITNPIDIAALQRGIEMLQSVDPQPTGELETQAQHIGQLVAYGLDFPAVDQLINELLLVLYKRSIEGLEEEYSNRNAAAMVDHVAVARNHALHFEKQQGYRELRCLAEVREWKRKIVEMAPDTVLPEVLRDF